MPQIDHKAVVPLLFGQSQQGSPRIKKDFLDLPFEIRKDIYIFVLRPDCSLRESQCKKMHKHTDAVTGCINILMTCSQIWREAIELLHQYEAVVHLDGDLQHALRGPLEFGKQGYFRIAEWDWPKLRAYRCQFDELQFIRLRKVVLLIDFAAHGHNYALRGRRQQMLQGQNRLTRARDKVKEIAAAISKSHTIESVRLVLRTDDTNSYGHTLLPPGQCSAWTKSIKKSLMPLIDAANRADIMLVFDQFSDDQIPGAQCDPFLTWLHGAALSAGVTTQLVNAKPSTVADQEQIDNDTDIPTVLEEDLVTPLLAANKYELVPECRTCYETFREWSELADHLTKQPKHKKSFVKKHFNKLHPTAVRDSPLGLPIRCNMCARSFEYRRHLAAHESACHHYSPVPLPKYQEDNGRRFKRRTHYRDWPQ